MPHYVPDIHLKQIDLDSIDDAEENPESVVFDILLSGHPTPSWVEEFEYLYATSKFSIKPPVIIDGDRLHIHFLPRYEEELQPYLEFVSTIAHHATDEARRTEAIKTHDDQEARKRSFRETLAKARVPA
ncbi:MAG TPA: hypothetical protein VGK19_10040 [Capsulimonadaceae bacterium]|jgi:hypothetical protein